MLSLNMVIIASMIGAGGLGFDVLSSLKRLNIGAGIEAGLAITLLAIALDRLSQAFVSRPSPEHQEVPRNFVRQHPHLMVAMILIVGTTLLALLVATVPGLPRKPDDHNRAILDRSCFLDQH